MTGVVEGHAVSSAVPRTSPRRSLPLPAHLETVVAEAAALGRTPVAVGWDGAVRGVLVVADAVKPRAREAVEGLRALGLEPILLTGDHEAAARAVAAQVGIPVSSVIAGVLPEGKAEAVAALQSAGRVVAMAGDGVNDAAALATADLGLSMGTGTDAAIEAADLTLVRTAPDGTGVDLFAAVDAIRLARRTLATIKGNLFWAFAYNLAAIPLAALGPSTPSSPAPRWPPHPCSWSPTPSASAASARPARDPAVTNPQVTGAPHIDFRPSRNYGNL